MSYKGFTWNMMASDAERVRRICEALSAKGPLSDWLTRDVDVLMGHYSMYKAVTPDGKIPPAFLYADS